MAIQTDGQTDNNLILLNAPTPIIYVLLQKKKKSLKNIHRAMLYVVDDFKLHNAAM